MEGISNSSSVGNGRDIQYGKFTLVNVTDRVTIETTKGDGPPPFDISDFSSTAVKDPEAGKAFWRRFFAEDALAWSPVTSDMKKELDAQRSEAIEAFFDGKISEEELSERFESLVQKFSDFCDEEGYPVPIFGEAFRPCLTEMFYSDFRREILSAAVRRGSEIGKQYMTGEMNANRTCKYYDADLYYKSEAAVGAITSGAESFAQKNDVYFKVPDYTGKNMYYNYNTAFSNSFDLEEQFILNPDQAPPEGFAWFYETGGKIHGNGRCLGSWSVDKNGNIHNYEYYGPTGFDPDDHLTARTWAAYKDKDGNLRRVETELIFKDNKEDLYNLASLLRFTGGDSSMDTVMNRFLKNFQLYPNGYWSRFGDYRSVNCLG